MAAKIPQQGLSLKQTQTLSLTPQLAQRLHLLQCNVLELETAIQDMLDKNVMLTVADPDSSISHDTDFDFQYTQTSTDSGQNYQDNKSDSNDDNEDTVQSSLDEVNPSEHFDDSDLDMEWSLVYDEYNETPEHHLSSHEEDGFQTDWLADEESFDERILKTIYFSFKDEAEQNIAKRLLNFLDDDYFLSKPVNEVAKALKVDPSYLAHIVDILKHSDLPGLASRDVRECLLCQLRMLGDNSETAINAHEILTEYYPYIQAKPALICSRMQIDEHELNAALTLIRTLSPFPNPVNDKSQQLIRPDVYVHKRMGMFFATSNPDEIHQLKINEDYAALAKTAKGDEKQFIQAQLQEAKFFLAALDERQKTIIRIANAVVMHQQDFFIEGDRALKPLRMKDIATLLDLSESTISRAVNGKYLSFQGRLIELRHFFTHSLATTENDASTTEDSQISQTAAAAKAEISRLVKAEDPKKPLSDQQLESALANLGISISRRTVAKYREALGIAKTSERKQKI